MSKEETKVSEIAEFADGIMRLRPQELVGLARLLMVPVLEDFNGRALKDVPVRNAEDLLVDLCLAFEQADRKTRRNILRAVKKASKDREIFQGVTQDGTTTKD